jgi:AraC-like DNA-binding protein
MKPEFEQVRRKSTQSFAIKIVKRDSRPLLTKAWHYHPEIEICYTPVSNGKRYVGNNISDYREKDLVVLGPNLPHGFTTYDKCEQYVIQFRNEFLGTDFLDTAEMEAINSLLTRSKRGLYYTGNQIEEIDERIKRICITDQNDFNRLIHLLELLDYLARSNELQPICTEKYSAYISPTKLRRIKTILDFIENNFQKDINIQDACNLVNLTESAFYKYIKRHTNKKFTSILNEYRLDHASKLLVSSNMPISDISYQSGFSNLSHFNRTFKSYYSKTPRQMRKEYGDSRQP